MSVADDVIQTQFTKSIAHQKKAHRLIPGAAHTYAKGDDQFPENMCPVIVRGEGSRVFDLDGNTFIEYGSGVRSVTLGHGYKPVCDAAYKAMLDGTNFCRPAALELKAAEKMLEVIDKADMVKFGKNGSDAVSGAVKLCRAYTGREMVAICGDHPFFSVDDWFMGTTAMNAGIPKFSKEQTAKFKYNDLPGVQALFDKYPNQIACLILEGETLEIPQPNYLHKLQDLCHQNGAIMILDETVTGFRWHVGGVQKFYDFTPDLSTFGKGMANGFSVAALCGKREYMRLAGLEHTDRERCFVLSLTHGAETTGLAACIASIEAYQKLDVCGIMNRQGTKLQHGLKQVIADLGMEKFFQIAGRPWLTFFATFDAAGQRSQEFRTLFLQELLKRGILAPSFVVNASHTDEDIQQTIEAVAESLVIYKRAIDDGVEKYLVGRPVKPVFRPYN